MTLGSAVVVAWAVLGAIHCLSLLYGLIAAVRRCGQLGGRRPRSPEVWPSLSVVVAACNEADTIQTALESLLAQDYPALQVVVVDDRSTDATGKIVAGMAARDPRVTAIRIRELPEGWLGKVHALERGIERANGTWTLFTDADVHFAPGTLRRAIACAEEQRLDHLAVLAQVVLRSFWVGVCHASAMRGVFALARPWEAVDPESKRAVGVGSFNLVRRAAFDRTPGFEWLRLEVADDIGLGLVMKSWGGRPGLMFGRGAVIVEWYRTLPEALRGLEKNCFAQAARFSLRRGLGMAVLTVIGSLGVFSAFLPIGIPWLWAVGATALLAHLVAATIFARVTQSPFAYAFFSLPIGDLLMAYAILRATLLGVRRGGVIWRGTVYPTALLRAGRRVDM